MQKDTVIHTIRSVMLDPGGHNVPYAIQNITDVAVNGQSLGLGGYLDIGLLGETTAETKVTLTKLRDSILNEED